jgi:multiple sugar transport system permease protein
MSIRTETILTSTPQTHTRPTWQKRWLSQETLIAWLFILPSLIGLCTFFIFPTLRGFYLSFTNSDLLTRADFIGIENYEKLIGDSQFWESLSITLYYVVLNIPLQTAIAVLLAASLDRLTKSIAARGTILLPFLVPMVMATLVWMTLLDYELGPINGFLKLAGLPRVAFLNQNFIIPSTSGGMWAMSHCCSMPGCKLFRRKFMKRPPLTARVRGAHSGQSRFRSCAPLQPLFW